MPHRVRHRRSARHGDRNRLAWGNTASIAISVALAFVFGYALTLTMGAGVPYRRAVGLTAASDTISIATMEVIDNAFLLVVPGALAAGLADQLFWWSLAAEPRRRVRDHRSRERWLIARGKGHAVLHHLH